ncbi:MAG: AbrB/MazE/SpoVT family DNA-binding domain-containing protein [Steroidobacteraceae bacterium]
MLTGDKLIAFVQAHEELNQKELAEAAGYVRTTQTGREQVRVKEFVNALLAAKGLSITVGRLPGKSARFETTVHRNGSILIGKTYSRKFGLKPGDRLEIVLDEDAIQLVPTPVKAESKARA